ncbi:hypothetical protein HID58_027357, partial [Brassica napus]
FLCCPYEPPVSQEGVLPSSLHISLETEIDRFFSSPIVDPSVSLVDLLLSLFSSLETGGVRFEGLWRCRQWGHGLTVDTEAFERAVVEICSVTHWLACLRFLSPHLLVFLSSMVYSGDENSDVEKLKKLILHNPVVLTLQEGSDKEEPVPSNVQQFWISCSTQDKLLHILALLKLEVVQKKVLIFINTIDMGLDSLATHRY